MDRLGFSWLASLLLQQVQSFTLEVSVLPTCGSECRGSETWSDNASSPPLKTVIGLESQESVFNGVGGGGGF